MSRVIILRGMSDCNSQSDSASSSTTNPDPSDPVPVLSYASVGTIGRTVSVRRYPNAAEAAIAASLLDTAGIRWRVLNSSVNGLGMPELVVNESDVDAAREVLSRS